MLDSKTAPYGALLLRVALGTMFIAHGLLKVLVFTPAGTVGYFSSLGVPGELAYLAMATELVGGAALILGIHARLVAVALIPLLAGTIVLVHGVNGWAFAAPGGGWEYPAFLIVASMVQLLLGDGALSLSRFIPLPAALVPKRA